MDILFFGNYLPYSKHFHILTAVPNIFFMKLDPPGRLATPDLEKSERFGASRVEDLTWKSMLDGYTCTECGRCRVVCPTALTGKPLDPRLFIAAIRDAVYEATPEILAAASGRGNGADGGGHARRDLVGGWISEDTIWACTTCGFCTSACPVFIVPAVDKIIEMRRYLVLDKAEFPKEMQTAFRGMETNGNPWGIAAASRADWAKELPVVTMAEARGRDIDVLFWVGCAGSYEDRAKKVSRALVELLQRGRRLLRDSRRRGDLQRRLRPPHGQRVPLPDARAAERRDAERVRREEGRHELPPLLQRASRTNIRTSAASYEVMHGTELVSKLIAEGRAAR